MIFRGIVWQAGKGIGHTNDLTNSLDLWDKLVH